MRFIFDACYLALIAVIWPFVLYSSIVHGKYRRGWNEKLWGRVPRRPGDRPCLWLHAVSVGEVNLLACFLKRFEAQHPDWECVISTTTRTGYELACKRYAPRTVFYCPLDFSWSTRAAMQRIRPTMLVLAELEIWPNLILAAHRHGTRIAVMNGRLSDRSFRGYQRIRPLMKWLLSYIDAIAVQDDEYGRRFETLGADADRVSVTGSLKFDGAESNRENPLSRSLAALWPLNDGDVILLAGSTQPPEESMALDTFRSLVSRYPHLRLVITPRHSERFAEVAQILEASGLAWQRRSELGAGQKPTARILLVDTIGELGGWWGLTEIAFVGGSMGSRGGQNMIEPAAYGAAVSFGPNTRNFRDIVRMLLSRQAAVVVQNGAELTAFVERCLAEPLFRKTLGARARQLAIEQKGAADRTLRFIESRCAPELATCRLDELPIKSRNAG